MQRKVFGAEFKAKVALEALAGRKTVNEIAGTRCVALNQEWEPFMNHHIQSETARLYANIPIKPQSAPLRLVA